MKPALKIASASPPEATKLILENCGKEYPDAPKRDPKEFADGSIIEGLKQEKFAEELKFCMLWNRWLQNLSVPTFASLAPFAGEYPR